MSRYTAIHSIIWRDDVFNNLSEKGKLFFIYTLTSPHSNMLGLYLLPKSYITYDMHWSPKDVDKIIQELQELDFIRYDENEMIYIPKFLKHNPITNINQMKGASNTLLNLPENSFQEDVLNILKASVNNASDKQQECMDSVYKGLIRGLEGASKRLAWGYEAATKERIKNKETRIKNRETRDPQEVAEYNKIIDEKFEEFWSFYPRKKDKRKARSRFASLFPLDMDKEKRQKRLQHMGLHLNQYVEETTDLEERYVKHPATWLNSVDFDFPPDSKPNHQLQWSDAQ